MFERLAARGLFGAYHAHHGIEHGAEKHATYHHSSRGHSPWHLDYCVLSKSLLQQVVIVDVCDEPERRTRSDHRPVTTTLTI